MIGVRIDQEEIWLEPEEWVRWIQDGRIPARARVLVDGTWTPVAGLEAYRRHLRTEAAAPPTEPPPGLRAVLFPSRGLSATEVLLLANLLVAGVLVLRWGDDYLRHLRQWTGAGWYAVRDHHAYWRWLATIFMHAGPEHLGRNMVSLLAGVGAVEFLTGRAWTYAVYLLTGVAGMAISYWGHPGPPISVGASGAIFGLLGATVAFLIRRQREFTFRQRWKARRIYVPLFVALFLPSLLHADYFAHSGGFLTGLVLGAFIPPHRRIRELIARGLEGERRAAGTS